MEKGSVFMVLLVALLIFLSVVLTTAVLGNNGQSKSGNWTLSLNAPAGGTSYGQRFVTDDRYLYTASGKTIYCLGPHGVRWSVMPGDPSEIMPAFDRWELRGAASDGGRSYLVAVPGSAEMPGFQLELIAVSDDGRLLWALPLDPAQRTAVMAGGGNVYVHNAGNVTAFDRNGKAVWLLDDIGYRPCVDDAGRLYALRGGITGSPLEAFYPNGTRIWSRDLPSLLGGMPMEWIPQNPFYQNGTLYLWSAKGLAALDANGTLKWAKHYEDQSVNTVSGHVPDANGNIYLSHINYYYDNSNDSVMEIGGSYYYHHDDSNDTVNNYMTVIGLDGSESRVAADPDQGGGWHYTVNGVAYMFNYTTQTSESSLNDFQSGRITALDMRTQQYLWNFTLPVNTISSVVLNESNIRYLMLGNIASAIDVNKLTPSAWYEQQGLPDGTTEIKGMSWINVYPGQDVLYVDYWAYNYEYPPFFGKANLAYTGGLFALNKEGRLLWSKQTDSFITGLAENNGTVIYATSDGRFSAVGVDIAAGIAAAIAYLLARIFALGTVSRARSRLETNENRNRILKLIVERPGSTMHEIARDAGLNVGTVRYHMLILSMNHKIAAHHDGTKFVRYFRNVQAYSDDEKLIIGLMRREPVRKVLSAMARYEAMTNQEISVASDMPESAVSKYLRELAAGGIVARSPADNEKPVYSVDRRYRRIIRNTSDSLYDASGSAPDNSDHTRTSCAVPDERSFQHN